MAAVNKVMNVTAFCLSIPCSLLDDLRSFRAMDRIHSHRSQLQVKNISQSQLIFIVSTINVKRAENCRMRKVYCFNVKESKDIQGES